MDNQVMVRWRHLSVQSQNMSMYERATVEAQMLADDRRLQVLAALCKEQHFQCRFGDSELYKQLLCVVELQMFVFGLGHLKKTVKPQQGQKIHQILMAACADKLPLLEQALTRFIDECTQNKIVFGSMRWLLLSRPQTSTDPPVSVRMLWTTLFSALWLCSGSSDLVQRELLSACGHVLGHDELLLFSLILCTLHIHYGLLPLRLYNLLLKINTTNLSYFFFSCRASARQDGRA